MYPAASVSGLYFAHPEARYFAVGRIGARPGRGLRAPQGRRARARSSAGWRPCSTPSPRRSRPERRGRRALRRPHHGRAGPPRLRAARHTVRGGGVRARLPREGHPPRAADPRPRQGRAARGGAAHAALAARRGLLRGRAARLRGLGRHRDRPRARVETTEIPDPSRTAAEWAFQSDTFVPPTSAWEN